MLRPIVDFVPEASPCCYYFVAVQVVYFQVAYSYYYFDQEVGAYYYPLHVAVHLVAVAYPPLAVDLLVVAAFLFYVPFSKISHYVYYFFAHYLTGSRYGYRGVVPGGGAS